MSIPKNVLVIDDDPILCEICKSHLQSIGVPRVDIAGDGRKALALLNIAGSPPDLVICDLNMPELDGIQFLRQVHQAGFAGHIAIVSGEDRSVIQTAQTLAETIGLKVAGIVKKPLRRAALEHILDQCRPPLDRIATTAKFSAGADELSNAIANNHILPFYQPLADIRTGAIIGVEALARWQHPAHGLIAPDQFIPRAEQMGMIDGVTDSMLQQCLDDVANWHLIGIPLNLAVNLTAASLNDEAFPDRLVENLTRFGLAPSALTLEITERVVLKPSPLALEVLARLRIKGFGLAIDDFGTGFSNMEQLRKFPYSKLKVDRAFVSGAAEDRFAAAGLKASVMLARELNMKVVAEGVETATDWRVVANHKVDEVQGYWVARPAPAEDFIAWYREHNGRVPQSLWQQVSAANTPRPPVPQDPFAQAAPPLRRFSAGD